MSPTSYRTTVEQVDSLSYNVRGFRLKLVDPPALTFKPGQFVIANVPQNGKTVKRAYSIASPPYEPNVIELCIQHLDGGIASTYFWKLKPGDTVTITGPHGNFVPKDPVDYDPVFIALGTGVAPLRSMIRGLLHSGVTRDMWLLFGTKYEHALLYESEFRLLVGLRRNFHYVPIVSRPKEWRGEVGHVQKLFQKHITDYATKEIYLCGWLEVVQAVCKDLEGLGVPKSKLHYEEWG